MVKVMTRRPAQSLMAELVIASSLIRVAEYFISLGRFFEFDLSLLITGVAVGMKAHGHTSIGPLDGLAIGGFLDGKDFVVVASGDHGGGGVRN